MASEQGWKQANRKFSRKKADKSNLICDRPCGATAGQLHDSVRVPPGYGGRLRAVAPGYSRPSGPCKRERLVRADHEMIDQLDIDQRKRVAQHLRQAPVARAG